MGVEDRDWYRDAQREREKQRQMDETRNKFASFTQKNLNGKQRPQAAPGARAPGQTGLIPMLLFWLLVMGLLYALMTHYLKPKAAQVLTNGDLVIARARDGHFYAPGTVNGEPVTFMVDTGASLVSVSEPVARAAGLRGGVPTTFHTANGSQPGRVVDGVTISLGNARVTNVRVGVGLRMSDDQRALLGQSFLSKFDIAMTQNKMVLRARPQLKLGQK
ncbi:TIGR02281 family clan AA aspartic protease [Rhodoferax sp.]|uniref:retropepsin-like aspartic protease family protein n=1 Tax=Rhodoferax sp. TaxID=50421 RepID=UPI0019F9B681|nr:TIGR02281 family clan AA aspartic protease [Rhodoferax sp.]MBE0472754.1 TIGR02281 family clan AA aspartic protease [Rhodoferax sp.]